MAEYTSRHTGLQIDEALDSALNVKQVRGIVKMTDAGPVAAVPGEDFPESSGSTVSVTGLLKGVRNVETNEIEIQQATAGTFLGAAPSIETSKTYEFDVYDGVWAVQEVVSA